MPQPPLLFKEGNVAHCNSFTPSMSAGNPACCDVGGGHRPPLQFKLSTGHSRTRGPKLFAQDAGIEYRIRYRHQRFPTLNSRRPGRRLEFLTALWGLNILTRGNYKVL